MDKIEELLTRGVEKIYPSKEELERVLRGGKKLRLYNGIDPTGLHLHLGHMVVLRKLRQFQDLGHETILLIGDFTARIGDPTDKLSIRYKLTKKQVEENAANYKKSISKILDLNKSNIRFLHNEKWTNKLKPEDMLDLASHFTVSQLLERDMFQERIKMGKEIYLHEFLYPMFQAYDSVTMDVDMEIGGNDQTFNMLCGRKLIKAMKNKDKFVMTTPLLTDSKGVKIGKTEGNVIALTDKPEDLFSKIMLLPDDVIVKGLEYLTDVSIEDIKKIEQKIKSGENPIEYKNRLAFEIVKQLYDEKSAIDAQNNFKKIKIKNDMLPVFDMPTLPTWTIPRSSVSGVTIAEPLINTGTVKSRSEYKNLIRQSGVTVLTQKGNKIEEKLITDPDQPPQPNTIIKVGNNRFVKIKTK